jgi:hypothetical protein
MSDEEQGSVLGGIAEAAGAAWDAGGDVSQAVADVTIGTGEFWAGATEKVAAAGAELVGANETRDDLDRMARESAIASVDSYAQAGQDLSNASSEVLGD